MFHQSNPMRKEDSFQQVVQKQLDIHMQEIKPTKLNLRCTADLNINQQNQKVLEETKEITFMTSGLGKSVLAHSKQ